MKTSFTFLFCLLVFLVSAQKPAPDSLTGRKADSLKLSIKIQTLFISEVQKLLDSEQYDSAKIKIDLAMGLAKTQWGEVHVLYALGLNYSGLLQMALGKLPLAEQQFRKAKMLWEQAKGPNHPNYMGIQINIGIVLIHQLRYEEAEQPLLTAKELFKTVPDYWKNEFYSTCLEWLGKLYYETYEFKKGKTVFSELLRIAEQLGGKESYNYRYSLNGLASLLQEEGQYDECEKIHLQLKDLIEKKYGKQHNDYAGEIINLGLLYAYLGKYKEAEQHYLEAKNIFENQLKDTTAGFYANCLYNLAMVYQKKGLYQQSLPLLQSVRTLDEKTVGTKHPYYALDLELIAACYQANKDYTTVEKLLTVSKKIKEETLGPENQATAASINLFGVLYELSSRYTEAETNYREAIAIWEKTLGKQHTKYLSGLNDLLGLFIQTKQWDKAAPLTQEAAKINRSLLQQGARYMSEADLFQYTNTFDNNLQRYLCVLRNTQKSYPAINASCYNDALFYKGFVLNCTAKIKNAAGLDTTTARRVALLDAYRHRLGKEYSKPVSERDSAYVAGLEVKANFAEKELVRNVAGFAELTRQVDWQEVQRALKPGEAAVEFVHYHDVSRMPTDSVFYGALVLLPLSAEGLSKADGNKQPQFIPLFEEKDLKNMLEGSTVRRMDYVADLYQSFPARGVNTLKAARKSLFELIWAPLSASLKSAHTVYFSPSGILHRLNMSAIAVNEDSLLSDRYELICLGSTRQLVSPDVTAFKAATAMVFGGVRFDMDSLAIRTANAAWSQEMSSVRGGIRFEDLDAPGYPERNDAWQYLKWTEKEANSVASILKEAGIPTQVRSGYEATEESFKQLGKSAGGRSPRILHISTHGFFYPDPKTAPGSTLSEEPAFKISDYPMIRSGLILAGANQAWSTGKPLKPDMEDGILTAYEISQMDLSGTELVVLSACETGLGDISGNEGVYGLQRAFKIAGARYLIMSLWQVPDFQTQELMSAFYRKWLKDRLPVRRALEAAQQELRQKGFEPYYWAGFVLIE